MEVVIIEQIIKRLKRKTKIKENDYYDKTNGKTLAIHDFGEYMVVKRMSMMKETRNITSKTTTTTMMKMIKKGKRSAQRE